MPETSICIPTRNYGHFLNDAVNSALSQTRDDLEILIIDNASEDNTTQIIQRLQDRDKRIRYMRNTENLGLAGNLNRCMESAKGKYIKFLMADDLLASDCLENMINCIDKAPEVSLVTGRREIFLMPGEIIGNIGYSNKIKHISGNEVIGKCLYQGNTIGEPSSVLFRNTKHEKRFNPRFSQLIDMEFWFQLLESGSLCSIPETVCQVRQHHDQLSRENNSLGKSLSEFAALLNDYGNRSYVQWTPLTSLLLKKYMANRIWEIRENLDPQELHVNIQQYSHYSIYWLTALFNKIFH
jgi:glycosyltransferase involved in cell wall biosynthesis